MGFNDMEDYELRMGNKAITDDDMVIDDSGMRDPIYDLQFHLYLEEDRKVYYYQPKPKTKDEKLKDVHTWFWNFKGDTLTMNHTIHSFNLQPQILDKSNTSMSAVRINFDRKFKTGEVRFILSDSGDMT